jgi:hypothetical protein
MFKWQKQILPQRHAEFRRHGFDRRLRRLRWYKVRMGFCLMQLRLKKWLSFQTVFHLLMGNYHVVIARCEVYWSCGVVKHVSMVWGLLELWGHEICVNGVRFTGAVGSWNMCQWCEVYWSSVVMNHVSMVWGLLELWGHETCVNCVRFTGALGSWNMCQWCEVYWSCGVMKHVSMVWG